ncbi:hypothetical protein D7D52_14690 [Nocardia yunnanensis]|uniref:Uncharacterized protein n=1 Tax=Nocardia yunnanensis TaxID=2382165 RepID=A0A386ZQN4_9NOCA|nr:lipase family protein [Nocardia yunnanensis]AYF79039.1 hypothetical protein D7D52_14690 [Nocardia yunnanensis]
MTSAPVASAAPSAADDPFYTAPAGYESTEPGTILRSRPVQVAALNLFPTHIRAWQLLYRTTDSHGDPYTAASTVMLPDGPVHPRPLLSYQTAVDAVTGMCRPSVALQQGTPIDFTNPDGPITAGNASAEILLAAVGLDHGWAVSIPDQGGVNDHFLTPREPGYIALDGIRAAEHFDPLTPAARDLVRQAKDRCTGQIVINADLDSLGRFLALPDFARYLTVPLDQFLHDPVIAEALRERGYAQSTPTAPIYLYNAVYDEASTIAGTDRQVSEYCANGASVTYRRDLFPFMFSAHGPVAVLGAPAAFTWLEQRMTGAPLPQGCDIQTVPSTLLDPAALTTFGSAIGTVLRTLLGLPLGG